MQSVRYQNQKTNQTFFARCIFVRYLFLDSRQAAGLSETSRATQRRSGLRRLAEIPVATTGDGGASPTRLRVTRLSRWRNGISPSVAAADNRTLRRGSPPLALAGDPAAAVDGPLPESRGNVFAVENRPKTAWPPYVRARTRLRLIGRVESLSPAASARTRYRRETARR